MKLATLKAGGRDGSRVVVSRDLPQYQKVPKIAATLQFALDNWDLVVERLQTVYQNLNDGSSWDMQPFDETLCHSPLPRAYQWADGSAYINHVELVRKARNAEVPASFYTDPLMYQGGSDSFVGPRDPIFALSEDWGIDLEAEVAVITGEGLSTPSEDALAAARAAEEQVTSFYTEHPTAFDNVGHTLWVLFALGLLGELRDQLDAGRAGGAADQEKRKAPLCAVRQFAKSVLDRRGPAEEDRRLVGLVCP